MMSLLGRADKTRVLVVTPACNEAEHLPELAASMEAQSLRPTQWLIVTNGCTDDTPAVADAIADRNPEFVRALHLGSTGRRSFAAKAHAVEAGARSFGTENCDLISCVDGDVILPANYFERVSEAFGANAKLGVAGGVYREPVGTHGRIGGHHGGHVPGPAQVLRSAVYDELGGYWPLEFGGLDAAACYGARHLGWETYAIDDLEFRHSRVMGTGGGVSRVRAEYLKGRQDWDLGNAWWFEAPKLVRKLFASPVVLGGASRTVGFVRGAIHRTRGTDAAFVAAVRREQRLRTTSRLHSLRRRR